MTRRGQPFWLRFSSGPGLSYVVVSSVVVLAVIPGIADHPWVSIVAVGGLAAACLCGFIAGLAAGWRFRQTQLLAALNDWPDHPVLPPPVADPYAEP